VEPAFEHGLVTAKAFIVVKIQVVRRAKLPFLTVCIKQDDLDAKVKPIEENGSFIVEPPLDLPSGSRICLFNEPSGVTLAMIQSAKK
jgi:predicted enzyme related to lactoylglutathione lyase